MRTRLSSVVDLAPADSLPARLFLQSFDDKSFVDEMLAVIKLPASFAGQ